MGTHHLAAVPPRKRAGDDEVKGDVQNSCAALLDDGFRIGIENKAMGAAEQLFQCQDYAEELQRLSRQDRWVLVFLTREDEGQPTTCGKYEGDKRIRVLPFSELAKALSDVRETVQAQEVKVFLRDFERYVRERIYGEERSHGESKMIKEFLQPEHIEVTLKILERAPDIRRELMQRFREEALARIRKRFGQSWEADMFIGTHSVKDFDEKYSGLYFFRPSWRGKFAIGFSNQVSHGKEVILGIHYWGRQLRVKIAGGQVQLKLNDEFPVKGLTTEWWDWYLYLKDLERIHYKDWYYEDVIRRMALDTHEMADDLCPLVEKVIEIAAEDIDREVDR